uniref:Uncharacterized protein n=1 Tax=Oryza glumipatula TaxID=40148 RepID=A0A0E0BUL7_9ORYZ
MPCRGPGLRASGLMAIYAPKAWVPGRVVYGPRGWDSGSHVMNSQRPLLFHRTTRRTHGAAVKLLVSAEVTNARSRSLW